MHVHSDLSGKEWIPAEVLGQAEGMWLDVPRRVYISGAFGSVIFGARTQAWLPFVGNTRWWSWVVYVPPKKFYPSWFWPSWTGRWPQAEKRRA